MTEIHFKYPEHFTFQWHLTDVCNFRCKHCYQTSYQDKGSEFQEITKLLTKIENFVIEMKSENKKFKAHFNFTGGEPFLYPDFLDLLAEVQERKIASFGILSNGYLLSESELLRLKKLNPRFIQISLEGNRKINDSIRGKNSYDYIINALNTYRKLRIPTMVSFTANAENYKMYPSVVRTARRYGAFKVWTDRYLPSSPKDNLTMNNEHVKEFFQIILNEQKKNKYHFWSTTQVAGDRALQFLNCGGKPYKCSAGVSLLTIMPNGDLFPCRRLPIKIGNIKNDSIFEILKKQELKLSVDSDCSKCFYSETCFGGLKCLSYAVYNNYNRKDPNCFMKI
jgi:radical SAM protein with 4Fe4S-binding SPASM domain